MPFFEYVVSNSGFGNPSGTDKYRQYLSISTGQSKSSGVTLPNGATSYAVTGVGFQPQLVIVSSMIELGGGGGQKQVWIGARAGTDKFGTKMDYPSYLGGRGDGNRIMTHITSQVLPDVGDIASFDSDGFTLSFSPALPGARNLAYFAARDGQYKIGTSLSPTASGTQAITGLGFRPQAVLFFSGTLDTLGTYNGGVRYSIGATDAGEGYTAWIGSKSNDIYTNCVNRPHGLSFLFDANNLTPIPWITDFHPIELAYADISSMDSNGFTLNWWVGDGVQRYYSWIAFDHAEVGRFIYNHSSTSDPPTSVPTSAAPKGLVFYCTDRGHDSLNQNDPNHTEGSALSIGYCGTDLTGQTLTSWGEVSRGIGGFPDPFGDVVFGHGSFGCWNTPIAGFALEDIDDGLVTTLGIEGVLVPMGYRMHHQQRVSRLKPVRNG